MRSREPELLLWWLLLPIFFSGCLPMLVFGFLGLIGLGMLGVLLVCVGLGNGLHANSDFNREVIVRGYGRRTGTDHSCIQFAFGDNLFFDRDDPDGRRTDRRRISRLFLFRRSHELARRYPPRPAWPPLSWSSRALKVIWGDREFYFSNGTGRLSRQFYWIIGCSAGAGPRELKCLRTCRASFDRCVWDRRAG